MATVEHIKIGDICHLKSGSRKLTVIALHDPCPERLPGTTKVVEVAWICYDTQAPHSAVYPVEALSFRS